MIDNKTTPEQLKGMSPRELADFLYRGAVLYARAHYKRHKILDPSIFALDANYAIRRMVLPPFEEGFSRSVLAGILSHRLYSINATAYCFVMEMFMRAPRAQEEIERVKTLVKQGHVFGVSPELSRLAESFPRCEMLAFNIAVPDLKDLKWFYVHRDKKGRLASLGEPDTTFMTSGDRYGGVMTNDKTTTDTRKVVTEEMVWRAADNLHRQYLNATVEAVRHDLDGGSPNTINKYLRTWRQKRKSEAAPVFGALPVDVGKIMEDLWRKAVAAAMSATSSEVNAAEEARKRVEKELLVMADELDARTQSNAKLMAEREELGNQFSDMERKLAAETSVSQERQGALVRLQAQFDELQRSSDQQLQQARVDRKAIQDTLDLERHRRGELEDAHRTEIAAGKAKLTEAHQKHQDDKTDWARRESTLQARLASAQESRDQFESDKKDLTSELEGARAEINGYIEKVSGLMAELSSMQTLIAKAQVGVDILSGLLANRDASLTENVRRIGELEGTVAELRTQITQYQSTDREKRG